MSPKPKRKLPKEVRRAIESALKHADMTAAFNGPRGVTPVCAIAEEHKKAMKVYLDTWVNGPLEEVLKWDDGEMAAYGIASWS